MQRVARPPPRPGRVGPSPFPGSARPGYFAVLEGSVPLGSLMLTGEQIRAARAFARIEQAELARRAGLSLETIKRLERIRGPVDANVRTLASIAAAFETAGIVFDFDQVGVGVRFLGGVWPRTSEVQRVRVLS